MNAIPLPPDVDEDVGLPEVTLPTGADEDGGALFASPGNIRNEKKPRGKVKPKAALKAKAKAKSKGKNPKAKGKAKSKVKSTLKAKRPEVKSRAKKAKKPEAKSRANKVLGHASEDFQSKAVGWTGTPAVPFDDLVAQVAGAFAPPMTASTASQRDHLWEIFSPPRVGPIIRSMGGRSSRSVDVKTFRNLRDAKIQHQLLSDVISLRPYCSWAHCYDCYDYQCYACNDCTWPVITTTKFY